MNVETVARLVILALSSESPPQERVACDQKLTELLASPAALEMAKALLQHRQQGDQLIRFYSVKLVQAYVTHHGPSLNRETLFQEVSLFALAACQDADSVTGLLPLGKLFCDLIGQHPQELLPVSVQFLETLYRSSAAGSLVTLQCLDDLCETVSGAGGGYSPLSGKSRRILESALRESAAGFVGWCYSSIASEKQLATAGLKALRSLLEVVNVNAVFADVQIPSGTCRLFGPRGLLLSVAFEDLDRDVQISQLLSVICEAMGRRSNRRLALSDTSADDFASFLHFLAQFVAHYLPRASPANDAERGVILTVYLGVKALGDRAGDAVLAHFEANPQLGRDFLGSVLWPAVASPSAEIATLSFAFINCLLRRSKSAPVWLDAFHLCTFVVLRCMRVVCLSTMPILTLLRPRSQLRPQLEAAGNFIVSMALKDVSAASDFFGVGWTSRLLDFMVIEDETNTNLMFAGLKNSAMTALQMMASTPEGRSAVLRSLHSLAELMFSQAAFNTGDDPILKQLRSLSELAAIQDKHRFLLMTSWILLDAWCSAVDTLVQKLPSWTDDAENWKAHFVRLINLMLQLPLTRDEDYNLGQHYLEIRRLDSLCQCHLLCGLGHHEWNYQHLVNHVYTCASKVATRPSSGRPDSNRPFEGVQEDWAESEYIVRRRALYALMTLAQGDPVHMKPYIETLADQVYGRMQCELQETERSLLTECLVSLVASSQLYAVQKLHISRLASATVDDLAGCALGVTPLTMAQRLFGSDWEHSESDSRANARRALSRCITQLESTIKRCTWPIDFETLENGGYLMPPPVDAAATHAELLVHPLSELLTAVRLPLCALFHSYASLWNKQTVLQAPWLLSFLYPGEEECGSCCGQLKGEETLKDLILRLYPAPAQLRISPEELCLARRHAYHLRVHFVRCLGRALTANPYMVDLSSFQMFLDHIGWVPALHLETDITNMWAKVIDENFLSLLLMPPPPPSRANASTADCGCLLVSRTQPWTAGATLLSLLQEIVNPALARLAQRLHSEWTFIEQVTDGTSDLAHTVRVESCSQIAMALVRLVLALFSLKTTVVTEATTLRLPTPECTASAQYVESAHQNAEKSLKEDLYSFSRKVSEFKRMLFDPRSAVNAGSSGGGLLETVLGVVFSLLTAPNVLVQVAAHSCLRVFVRHTTKNFMPLLDGSSTAIAEVFCATLLASLRPPSFDPYDANRSVIKASSALQEFMTESGQAKGPVLLLDCSEDSAASAGYVSNAVATLYDALRGIYRCQVDALCRLKPESDPSKDLSTAALMESEACQKCVAGLRSLPVPITDEELQIVICSLCQPRATHESKDIKQILRNLLLQNLVSLGDVPVLCLWRSCNAELVSALAKQPVTARQASGQNRLVAFARKLQESSPQRIPDVIDLSEVSFL